MLFYGKGDIKKGKVIGYDQESMTAIIEPEDMPGVNIQNVVCLFDRYDENNNAFSFRAPSVGSPCIYTKIGNETFLLGLYPPLNITDKSDEVEDNSLYGGILTRKPKGMRQYSVEPGNIIDTNSFGSEDSFSDTMKKIVIFPKKLSSIWNALNFVWENICLIFRLYTGAMDITSEVNTDNTCDTTLKFRKTLTEREQNATTIVDLRIGNDANVIKLFINGKPFVHVDADRNVEVIAKQIDVHATNINFDANEFNCLNVGTVKLP